MSRVSANQVYVESVNGEGVRDSEKEEGGAIMEEQTTLKRRRLNADTRHSNGNQIRSSHQGAMGQEESREMRRERNAALHSAGPEARQPKGKLPRRSGGPLHTRQIPLAHAGTFDVLDDNEEDSLPNKVRRTPIRRTAKPSQSASYRSPAQAFLDEQLGQRVDGDPEQDAEQDEVDAESEGHEQEEVVVDRPQQSGSGKKGRGRPRKSIQLDADGKRRPGRPSKHNQPDNQRRAQSIQPSSSAIRSPEANAAHADPVTPDTTTAAPTRKVGRPKKADAAARATSVAMAQRSSNSHAQMNVRRSARFSGDNIEPTASIPGVGQPGNDANRAAPSTGGRRSSARESHSNEQQQATEEMASVAQHVVIDDEQHDDQAHDANEEAEEDDEDHEPQGNDGPEENDEPEENGESEVDEAEARPEPPNTDPHRLHRQWGPMRGILREVVRHRDETPNIPDDTFNETLRACKVVRRTVRTITSDIGLDELEQIISECRSSVSRAEALCSDTSDVPNRDDRGYHIFKFLMPALAKLLKSVIEALERVDIEGAGLPQISMAHLLIVINLVHALYICGNEAYHAYTKLDPCRPVKNDVHARITVPLRDLHAALKGVYQRRVQTETASLQAEAMAAELEARVEERERLQDWRNTEMRNQAKWKKMDTVRRNLVRNSMDERKRLHIYSCPSAIVETREDGQPLLPAKWRRQVTTFTMRELAALREGLQKHVDTPLPLKSEVFENLMLEYCRFGGELSERNTLEIVRQSNDLRAGLIKLHKDNGTQPPRWVWLVPVWMEPVRY